MWRAGARELPPAGVPAPRFEAAVERGFAGERTPPRSPATPPHARRLRDRREKRDYTTATSEARARAPPDGALTRRPGFRL